MQNQCIFLTEIEKAIVEFLKDSPKHYRDIVKKLQEENDIKDRRTVNKYLRELEDKKIIFRVTFGKEIFFKLNIFPYKARLLFGLADKTRIPELLELKDIILKKYPALSLEEIIRRYRKYLEFKPKKEKNKGLINLLKDLEEGDILPLKP
ncbi:hypothetical protein J7L13_01105 [bacterium]|nr:hypothetical protein [bacterium]